MGSYENIVKIEEMRRRMEEGDTASAQKILDTMELKKVKNMSDLSLIAEVFAENERYEEALPLYLRIYEKTKSRKSLFQLVDIYIRLQNHKEAEFYLMEYEKLASKDFYKYIFRYRIDKLKGEPYETLIATLETLKSTEYMEMWAYELAKNYYKAGMEKECIQECSDIILWFGEGIYVEKARLLRSYYSGETDKEMIMEELKRRAMEDTGRLANATEESTAEIPNETMEYSSSAEEYGLAAMSGEEEEIATTEEFPMGEADSMGEEDPLGGEQPIREGHPVSEKNSMEEELVEELPSGEEASVEEELDLPLPSISSEQELAEQEVEQAIYQLLEEEEMDEEDKRLKQFAEDLQIDIDEIFGNFLHIKSVKKQLVKSLEGILDINTKTVQLLITGTNGSGKTTLAKDITMFLYKTGKLKSSRIAKIKGEKLNSIDIMSKKDTLRDCCLVVENASDLRRETIEGLIELCRILKGSIAVVFEENKKNINKLFREYPQLMDLFKNRIHLPTYTMVELQGFAFACLKQKDYCLNQKAQPILMHKLNQIVKQYEPNRHLEQINQLMQSAMDAADIRAGKQLSRLASQGRLSDLEVLTILSEDLMIIP